MQTITGAVRPIGRPEKILQFGEGNFLRAFVDWQIDILNEKTDFNGNVVAVQPLERGMAELINAQEGLYTTILRGVQGGETLEELRTIRSLSRCINCYTGFDDYLRCAENPELRFVISNTTEAGIAYDPEDRLQDRPPRSFPGKLTVFLYHRFKHFGGDPARALVFIPCELIDKNGDRLREIIERYSSEWGLGEGFSRWLACSGFCNSLVDRIVPGYPGEEAGALAARLGYDDRLLDAAELFHLWVIESPVDYRAELPLDQAGLNVIWTRDMSFYRTRKVRILNGAHTATVLAAFLYGLDTVEACVRDELVSAFMRKALFEEIIPSMEGSAGELRSYAASVLERFANPYIKHLLLSISLNSVSKFKTRVLPSITGYFNKTGKLPPALCFSLAALIAFYEGQGPDKAELTGSRQGEPYPIRDDEAILRRFAALYKGLEAGAGTRAEIVHEVLGCSEFWGEDLRAYTGLEDIVAGYLEAISREGIKAVLEQVAR
ncbi:MAG: tagaturonate reductase [Treponema sp.]|jgi:tagaturonate reductase|nr:tagaturonate reductase [Treponema sp.]